jgi:hypothetical protein
MFFESSETDCSSSAWSKFLTSYLLPQAQRPQSNNDVDSSFYPLDNSLFTIVQTECVVSQATFPIATVTYQTRFKTTTARDSITDSNGETVGYYAARAYNQVASNQQDEWPRIVFQSNHPQSLQEGCKFVALNAPVTQNIGGTDYTEYGTWFQQGNCGNWTVPGDICQPDCALNGVRSGDAKCEKKESNGVTTYEWDMTGLTNCMCPSAASFPQLAPVNSPNSGNDGCLNKKHLETCTAKCSNQSTPSAASKKLYCIYGQLKNFGDLASCACIPSDIQKMNPFVTHSSCGASTAAGGICKITCTASGASDPATGITSNNGVPWPVASLVCDAQTGLWSPAAPGVTLADVNCGCQGSSSLNDAALLIAGSKQANGGFTDNTVCSLGYVSHGTDCKRDDGLSCAGGLKFDVNNSNYIVCHNGLWVNSQWFYESGTKTPLSASAEVCDATP